MNKKISSLPVGHRLLNWGASVQRLRVSGVRLGLAALAGSSLLLVGSLRANTELDVASGLASGSNLSVGTSYTAGTAPTATSDVTFNAANTYTPPYTFGSAVTIGSLNDLSATAISLSGSALTLAGGDSVSGNTADLLYVGAGAALTDSEALTLGKTGNFDVFGTSTLSGVIGDGGNGNSNAPAALSFGLVKTGAGTLILSANNTYTGGTTVNAGTLQMNFGGQGYSGLRGAVTVNTGGTLALNAVNALGYNATTAGNSVAQLTINGGTVNNLSAGDEGYTANLTMTGGTLSSTGGGNFNFNPAAANAPSINTNASATTALISTGVTIRNSGNLAVNVASGTTASGSDLTVSGAINQLEGGTGALTKNGAGTLLLTAANTYTGTTTVNAGRLFVSGSTAGGAVTVSGTGTTLGGTGTIGGAVTVGAGSILTAGNLALATPAVGTLNVTGTLTLATGSTFNALLASNTSNSTLLAGGTTALGGAAFSISLTPGATFTNGTILQLIGSPVSGAFTDTSYTAGGHTFVADYTTDAGFFDVDVMAAAVPEPSTWAALLALAGLAGGARLLRRRSQPARVG